MRTVALLLACGAFSACGDDDDPSCPQPSYLGEATDEVWRTMVDADHRAVEGDPNAPVLSEPEDGAEISASSDGLHIRWSSPIASRALPLAPHGRAAGLRGSAPAEPLAPQGRGAGLRGSSGSVLDDALGLFEGTAWAHLPPVTGDVYWVRVTIPDRTCAVEAMTTDLEWSLSGDAWEAVQAAAGQSVRVELTSAYLNENRITEGPYRAAPSTVTIVP